MSTTTANLQLKKPAMSDQIRTTITDIANNLDIIDSSLAENAKQLKDIVISAKDKQFGAKGDGVTDDTVAIQSFFTYISNNHLTGVIPAGTYIISDEIIVNSQGWWKVEGVNANTTVLKQKTDNKPILHYTGTTSSFAHSVQIRGIAFDYVNTQPSTNTNSNAIVLDAMIYESIFDDLSFNGGYYGIYVSASAQNPWGCTFDNLRFGSALSGGAIWMSTLNGVPNNHFGRLFVSADNMIGPIFYLKGYNTVIDTIEIIQANKGAKLFYAQAGAKLEIGAIKLENGIYTGSATLIEFSPNSHIHIGSVSVGGSMNMTLNPATGFIGVISSTGGSPTTKMTIGHVEVTGTNIANTYIFGTIGNTILHSYNIIGTGWGLTNVGGATACENVIVTDHMNNHLSANKGDADYTIVLGDPNIVSFETTLTASRTVNLPSVNNNLFNGLKYRVRSYGAVNGTNVINIVCNGVTKATLSTDKTVIELTYRRSPSNPQSGWIVTDYVTLP
jgi:hypothetical protein